MSKWLNGNIAGKSAIQRELFPTEEEAIDGLTAALSRHKLKGHSVAEVWHGPKPTCEVRLDGDLLAVYWLSDEEGSPQPRGEQQ
jgi:hypothetical protein